MRAELGGHLFVTHGNLLKLACDAILVTSGLEDGKPGHMSGVWDPLELPVTGKVADERNRAVLVRESRHELEPDVWVGHTGATGEEKPAWYAKAVTEFISRAGSRARRMGHRPLGDPRPLLGIPIVGTGHGGMARRKGEVVKEIVATIVDQLAEVDADVVFVLNDAAAYAAVQQARSRKGDGCWRSLDAGLRELAEPLVKRARANQLVLFMGAGTSMGAGLPSWNTLLRQLAHRAGVDDESALEQLDALDPRDAGLVLDRRLTRQGRHLADEIETIVRVARVSLVHQLLASLPVTEAVTTNYDRLFEDAWTDACRPHSVLPLQPAEGAGAWLLKLHGSIDDKKRIVLSRDDYLRFEGDGVALAGLVQAMLLTRHVMFVGYRLSDDNFHRLVHQVRGVVGRHGDRVGERFATALTPDPLGLATEVWKDDVRFISTSSDGRPDVRQLAMLLDHLAFESSAPATHLLDESYRAVFNDDEWRLQQQLRQVADAAAAPGVRPALRQCVTDALAQFGPASQRAPLDASRRHRV